MNDESVRTTSIVKLAAVPALLAIAAVLWLSFAMDWHWFDRDVRQEQRRAESVGAKTLPIAPIQVVLRNRKSACLQIESAELDGTKLVAYFRNACHSDCCGDSAKFKTRSIAPDGTVIRQSNEYTVFSSHGGQGSLAPGERGEYYQDFEDDPRIEKVEVWIETPAY